MASITAGGPLTAGDAPATLPADGLGRSGMRQAERGRHDLMTMLAAVFVAQQVLINVTSLTSEQDISYIHRMFFGHDFSFIYHAAANLLAGADPYADPHYVAPPLSAWLAQPLALLPLQQARVIFFALSATAVYLSLGIALRFFGIERRWPYLVVMFLYPPLYWLLDRGNLDGLVGLTLAAGLLGRGAWRGVALGLGAAIKLYPLAILAALLLHRRVGAALLAVAAVGVLSAVVGHLDAFLEMAKARGAVFLYRENASIVTFPLYVAEHLTGTLDSDFRRGAELWAAPASRIAMIAAAVVYLGSLGACGLADLRMRHRGMLDERTESLALLLYVPFLVAIPLLSIWYALVGLLMLLPAAAWLQDRHPSPWHGLFAVGFALTGLHSYALSVQLDLEPLNVLPSLGLSLILVWCAVIKTAMSRQPTRHSQSAPPLRSLPETDRFLI